MKYKIIGDSDCPVAQIALNNGEIVKVERGAMAYMSQIELKGKMNARKKGIGGMIGAIGRSLASGESMFMTEARATADGAFIGVAPALPGAIAKLTVGDHQYRLNDGAFLASDASVSYAMKTQKLGQALFGGTGDIFVMETEGSGDLLINAFGALVTLEVHDDQPLVVDNEHVLAWDVALDYDIEVASGTFGFTTGEGLVNRFSGNGQVIIQTRNIHSLAESLQAFFPKQSN